MKGYLDQLIKGSSKTFSLTESGAYHALNDLHYHPEMELIYIMEGEGALLIGETLEQVHPNTMILIGANVPHMFKFDTFTYQHLLMKQGRIPLPLKLLTLHFNPEILGESFMLIPENATLNNLLNDALKGLYLFNDCRDTALTMMRRIIEAPNHEHIFLLLQMFATIAISKERAFITNPPDKNAYNKTDENRLTKIYLYTLDNFSRVIKLKEVADIVYMVPNAFCRYFKLRTNKSYFTFLMETRIRHACKLLREKDYSIAIICNESGFSNLSNFNRHFKLTTGKTPLEYRKNFQG